MTESTSPRSARSREKLLRAATDLLVDSGARAVTVDAVADRSGVAKSTLYRHWPSRDEMLVDVVRCNVPELPTPEVEGSFATILHAYLTAVAATLADPEWSRIIPALMSLRVTMPGLAEVLEADRGKKADTLASILELGAAEGVVPSDLDARDVEKLLFGPLVFASILGEHDRVGYLADAVVEQFLDAHR